MADRQLLVRFLFGQRAHRLFQAAHGQRIHPVVHQLLDDADAVPVLPDALGFRVDPDKLGECTGQALQPYRAGLRVVVFHAAARLQNFIRTHGRVAHKDEFVVLVVGSQNLQRVELLSKAAAVVFPHEVVDAVVEIKELQVFELGFARAE